MSKLSKKLLKKTSVILSALVLLAMTNVGTVLAVDPTGEKIYTTEADFNSGTPSNTVVTNVTGGEVKLDDQTAQFNYIWVAVSNAESNEGTIVKINTDTGAVEGKYKTAPDNELNNPSRTTVDNNGTVWVANRDNNSVTHVVTEKSGLWQDRNGNGICDTSTGINNVLGWDSGNASAAVDECIVNYVKTTASGTRHISIDGDNNVWVSGTGTNPGAFDKIHEDVNPVDNSITTTKTTYASYNGYGGYGGLIDKKGVIWSATTPAGSMLRWDTIAMSYMLLPSAYGLGIDSQGNVWGSSWYTADGLIKKYNSVGAQIGAYSQGGSSGSRGVVADHNDNIWIANSDLGRVTHLANNGTMIGQVDVGSTPTGVAVDAAGKIWVTCLDDGKVYRIDPTLAGGVGEVDFISDYLGGNLYNYSDMTGSTIQGAPTSGTWTATFDSGIANAKWCKADWTAVVSDPVNSALQVQVASSTDGTTFSAPVDAEDNVVLPGTLPNGEFLKVIVTFTRNNSNVASPILQDIKLICNEAPVVGPITGPNPIPVNTPSTYSADFTDPVLGTEMHTALWDWGDGSTSAGTVTPANGPGSVTGSHSYATPGIYTISVTVTDEFGASGTSTFVGYIVVYDPSGGFVTGGGWIDSPAGAYPANESLTGKANFGFVSKYQKGAKVPTGVTEFQFQVADLNFHSNSYDWLVIAGNKAMYKGTGTINGEGEYAFILSAIDSSPDMFRIKIWEKATDTLIYDNKIGAVDDADPSTPLGGGSIIIHKGK